MQQHRNDGSEQLSAHFSLSELTFSQTAVLQQLDNTPNPQAQQYTSDMPYRPATHAAI